MSVARGYCLLQTRLIVPEVLLVAAAVSVYKKENVDVGYTCVLYIQLLLLVHT